jgi:3-oxoadipate enol-lactonase
VAWWCAQVTETPTGTLLRLSDHDTEATIRGDGPPILAIHAIGLDRRMWDEVALWLATDATVIAYDLRGHGAASGAPPITSIAHLAADAAALLKALDTGPVHVIGLSLGGAVAQELALGSPSLVSGLTLCATLCKGRQVARDRADHAEHDGMAGEVEPTIERWFTPAFVAAEGAAVTYARMRVAAMDVGAWAAAWRALADLDTRDRLTRIAVPTRVVVGDADISTPVAVAREICALIAGATLEVVPGGPHMLSLECAAELAAGIAAE